MTGAQMIALLPLLMLAATVVAVLVAVSIRRHHGATLICVVTGLLLTLAMLPLAAQVAPLTVTPLFIVDGYGLFFTGLLTGSALITTLLMETYLNELHQRHSEFYMLLVIATLGGAALACSQHLASLLLSLETTSVALFAMIAYRRDSRLPIEAAIKYLVLVGVSTAFLSFGLALVYAATGELDFAAIGAFNGGQIPAAQPILVTAFVLIIAGLAFKLSLVPFHLWTPDVYQGAPAPVSAFLATASKAAVFAVLMRYLLTAGESQREALFAALGLLAVASMLVGNWLALLQTDVKRILAYSSIAHMGYLLVALIAGDALGVEAAAYYLAAYFATTLGAFAVMTRMTRPVHTELSALQDFRGLFWQHPWLAGAMTLMLLSLAGIPLTGGFLAKFYALAAGVENELWLLVLILVAGSAIGLFYYLRVIVVMFANPEDKGRSVAISRPAAVALSLLTVTVIILGVLPQPVIDLLPTLPTTLGGLKE